MIGRGERGERGPSRIPLLGPSVLAGSCRGPLDSNSSVFPERAGGIGVFPAALGFASDGYLFDFEVVR